MLNRPQQITYGNMAIGILLEVKIYSLLIIVSLGIQNKLLTQFFYLFYIYTFLILFNLVIV